ncbi:TPA: hypothetical protein KRE82_003612 [Clostridioides difficile]|nr:hypothetical protein [Clostridioides difficile]
MNKMVQVKVLREIGIMDKDFNKVELVPGEIVEITETQCKQLEQGGERFAYVTRDLDYVKPKEPKVTVEHPQFLSGETSTIRIVEGE